jgi:hypothetical protein
MQNRGLIASPLLKWSSYKMPQGHKHKNVAPQTKDISFKCKICGQEKPLTELVILRQYYPQLSCCRECAKSKPENATE